MTIHFTKHMLNGLQAVDDKFVEFLSMPLHATEWQAGT